jgi:hypothetical protein
MTTILGKSKIGFLFFRCICSVVLCQLSASRLQDVDFSKIVFNTLFFTFFNGWVFLSFLARNLLNLIATFDPYLKDTSVTLPGVNASQLTVCPAQNFTGVHVEI